MTTRLSAAFAAYRTQVVEELKNNLVEELVPNFNAEVADIRIEHDKNAQNGSQTYADHKKRARILDLKVRQQEFIKGLDQELNERLSKRVVDYGGQITERTITDGKEEKKVLEAVFPDKSTARVPKHLWIDYNQFDRV